MSAILKMRLPFFRKKESGGSDGRATFYLAQSVTYLPAANQTVTVTHTNIKGTGLLNKLSTISTNTVTARFIEFNVDTTPTSIADTDGFGHFMILQYTDLSFSTNIYGGDCSGFIEYDVNPTTLSVLKPVETPVIVSESVPYDLFDGYNILTNIVTGGTIPTTGITRGMFVRREESSTIFANLLRGLNLPVTELDLMKYKRSQLGTGALATGTTFDYILDGQNYTWTPWTSTGSTAGVTLFTHPTSGFTGEYYGTVLQTVGSYDFMPTNKAALPTENDMYLIFEIPNNEYGEIIDGKTFRMTLPYYEPTGITGNTLINQVLGSYAGYSSTPTQLNVYGTYNKSGYSRFINMDRSLSETDISVQDIGVRPNLNGSTFSDATYQSNIVLLFSDTINTPADVNFPSWSGGTVDVMEGIKVFSQTAGISKPTYNYFNDKCIGFVVLDKGFVVITHPLIVDSYFKNVFDGTISSSGTWDTGSKVYDYGALSTGTTRGLVKTDPTKMITTIDNSNNVYWDSSQFIFTGFTGATSGITSNIEYRSYNTEKSLNIVCLASANEFFRSTNDTAKELFGLTTQGSTTSTYGLEMSNLLNTPTFADFQTGSEELYPVIITGLGLHDRDGNLLAICKPSQPVKKYWYDVVSFNIRIRL
jgi:hypothetical protein